MPDLSRRSFLTGAAAVVATAAAAPFIAPDAFRAAVGAGYATLNGVPVEMASDFMEGRYYLIVHPSIIADLRKTYGESVIIRLQQEVPTDARILVRHISEYRGGMLRGRS